MHFAAEFLICTAVLAALGAPGALWAARLFPDWARSDQLIFGGAIGLALAAVLAGGLSYYSLALFPWAWLLLLLAAALSGERSVLGTRGAESSGGTGWALVLLLAAVGVSRLAAGLFHELPQGWDPAFHLLLARKVLQFDGMIFDWRPFAPVRLHYPLGSHLLIALVKSGAGVTYSESFAILMSLAAVLSSGLVYLIAQRALADRTAAVYSAAAYAFLAVYGSVDYLRWGGLPNQLGMIMLLAAVVLFYEVQGGVIWHRRFRFARRFVLGLFFAAAAYLHHHSALTIGLLSCALLLFSRKPGSRRAYFRELFGGAVIAAGLSMPEISLRLAQLGAYGQTSIFRFREPFFGPVLLGQSIGWLFAAAALAGMLLLRRCRAGSLYLPAVCGGTLLALFILCGYLYRAAAQAFVGEPFVLLTPSRFLTDASYFLAVPAGFALHRAAMRLRFPAAAGFLLICVGAAANGQAWAAAAAPPLPEGRLQAYRWIRRATAADTVVLDENRWCAFLTERRCSYTPIPISEPVDELKEARRLFETLARGVVPHQLAGKRIVRVVRRSGEAKRQLWRDSASGYSVVEIWAGEAEKSH